MDLDALLEQALDEFSDDVPAQAPVDLDSASDRAARAAAASPSHPDPGGAPSAASGFDPASTLEKLLHDMGGEDFQRRIAAVVEEAAAAGAGGGPASSAAPGTGSSDEDLLRTLELLQRMTAEPLAGSSTGPQGAASEADLRRLSEELERLKVLGSSGPDAEGGLPSSVDGLMQQLVSRDVMYEPMQALSTRLASWLVENAHIGAADRARYEAQLDAFRRVLAHYDSEPENFDRLMELITALQTHGQPPPEVVRELAPGLDLEGGAGGGGLLPPFAGGGGGPSECGVM